MKVIVFAAVLFSAYLFSCSAVAQPVIYVNQVAFDLHGPKTAVIGSNTILPVSTAYSLVNSSGETVFSGKTGQSQTIAEWMPGTFFYPIVFTAFDTKPGQYRIRLTVNRKRYDSEAFAISEHALAKLTIPSILHYYRKQRANTPPELSADHHLTLLGSDKTVDMHGGWCDASGDVSKYFSHLAYANYVSPQQTPLVTWSLISTSESASKLLTALGVRDSIIDESLWGADYIMRSLSASDYFYMIVFSYFNKDPKARRVVGLLANSVTTSDYQCAFREGGGMAIAALARISRWQRNGDFTSAQYLDGARRAFAHLLVHNLEYDDDHKENIIDDYCALMAATELWMATDSSLYRDEARKRAGRLASRISPQGYFIANDSGRPFWHAADAGLPVVALARYLKKETNKELRDIALAVIRKWLDYNLRVSGNVSNPFGYARQTFRYRDSVRDGFFIPHENETGWWWQGEDARLGSLATAAIEGGRLVYPASNAWGVKDSLALFASRQISWILGCNPYSMCFMYGFGKNNVPYMHSNYGHGSESGGISNGITGKDGNGDGSGIDFKTSAEGNEWRWTEQWLPHAAWFLQAVAAINAESGSPEVGKSERKTQ